MTQHDPWWPPEWVRGGPSLMLSSVIDHPAGPFQLFDHTRTTAKSGTPFVCIPLDSAGAQIRSERHAFETLLELRCYLLHLAYPESNDDNVGTDGPLPLRAGVGQGQE